MIANILLLGAAAGILACTAYLALVLIAAFRFHPAKQEAGGDSENSIRRPPVTILKPLHGLEPFLDESLESFFAQAYPTFELIFGAREATDPALKVVESLAKKYPEVRTQIVLSGEPKYPNAKVFLLEKMIAAAIHEILVIADSDVRVTSDYLASVVAPLREEKVGLVTCLYRGVPSGGVWSHLEALGMSVEMSSGVLVADLLEGMKFALGPTMATRKDVVDKVGGIAVLGDYCADDFVLGSLTAAAGKTVVLSRHVIDHIVLNRSARESLLHQVRWMKSARFSRPLGHLGTGLTFAIPFGLLGLAAGWLGGDWELGLGLLAVAVANRVVMSAAVGWGVLRDRLSLRYCWLYPVRDLLGFCFWCASFLDSGIVWRGERYRLVAGGRMVRTKPANHRSAAAQDAAL